MLNTSITYGGIIFACLFLYYCYHLYKQDKADAANAPKLTDYDINKLIKLDNKTNKNTLFKNGTGAMVSHGLRGIINGKECVLFIYRIHRHQNTMARIFWSTPGDFLILKTVLCIKHKLPVNEFVLEKNGTSYRTRTDLAKELDRSFNLSGIPPSQLLPIIHEEGLYWLIDNKVSIQYEKGYVMIVTDKSYGKFTTTRFVNHCMKAFDKLFPSKM